MSWMNICLSRTLRKSLILLLALWSQESMLVTLTGRTVYHLQVLLKIVQKYCSRPNDVLSLILANNGLRNKHEHTVKAVV